jgi:NADPH2:quinone reductase
LKALLCTQYAGLDQLSVQEVASPHPGPGQLKIDVKSASLNFPDVLMVQGLHQTKPELPFTPGLEYAGVVAEVGIEVHDYQVGDRVIAFGSLGGFAEEAVADAARVMPLPATMDYDVGAGLVAAYCTSLRGLKDRARLEVGETLLVLGAAGGVGIAAVEIGRAMGARVIAAASTDEKLVLCRELGAHEVVNYATEDLRERLHAITGGGGVDVVFDPVGGAYTEQALRATGWGGRLVVVGFATGDIAKIPSNLCLLKERSVVGVYLGDSLTRDPRSNERNVAQLLQWFAEGKINPHIDERVPLAEAPRLMARMLAREIKGKAVVLPEVCDSERGKDIHRAKPNSSEV